MAACGFATTAAQEKPTGEPAPEPTLKASAVIMSASSDGSPMEIQAIDLSGGGPMPSINLSPMMMGKGMTFSMGMSTGGGIQQNSVNWLDDEDVLKELEVVEEQRERLRQLRDEVQNRRQEFGKTVRDLPSDKRIDFIREFSDLLNANIDGKIKEILLPHQMKRFDQLRMQTQVRNGGVRALENKQIADLLKITDQQREELRRKREEVEENLRKKIEQLRAEAQQEMLSVLTPAQRSQLKDVLGKDYEFKPMPVSKPASK
jgi:Spy/CpxP family protein refolding chaperone